MKAPRIRIKNRWIPDENWRDCMVEDADTVYSDLWNEYIMVDVLSLHFEKNTMRVRTPNAGTQDIPAAEFFEQMMVGQTLQLS